MGNASYRSIVAFERDVVYQYLGGIFDRAIEADYNLDMVWFTYAEYLQLVYSGYQITGKPNVVDQDVATELAYIYLYTLVSPGVMCRQFQALTKHYEFAILQAMRDMHQHQAYLSQVFNHWVNPPADGKPVIVFEGVSMMSGGENPT